MAKKYKVSKDMLLGEIVEKFPKTAPIMASFGLHCIGCHVSAFETLGQGAKAHGLSGKQLKEMLEQLNKAAE